MFYPVRVSCWEEARRIPRELTYWIFRGQADETWSLSSRIERDADQFSSLSAYLPYCEGEILREFQRRAHHYLASPPDENELLEWLALIRHHGGPTRLLDFSHSFYVAAFFAVEESRKNKPAAVWGINNDGLRSTLMKKTNGNNKEMSDETNQRHICMAEKVLKEKSRDRLVLNVEPHRLNERLAIQQGLFLFPCDIQTTFEENLLETFDLSSSPFGKDNAITIDELSAVPVSDIMAVKIILPYDCHADALRDLRKMNITAMSLFPGLDGLARSFSRFLRPIIR